MTGQKLAQRNYYGKALKDLAESNPDVVVLDADLAGSTKTSVFNSVAPERFVEVGIAEQDMIGIAAGLAASGKTVFASTFGVFATGRCWEQIRLAVAYPRLNVKIVATHCGITVGEDGASHQALEDIAIMRAIPNMIVRSFEGENDGLLTPRNAKWTNFRGVYMGKTGRGISHPDETDYRQYPFVKGQPETDHTITDMIKKLRRVFPQIELKTISKIEHIGTQ